jgi:hypothetical protein
MTARALVLAEALYGPYRVEHDVAVDASAVLAAVRDPGVVLKRSHKFVTRRVGDWLLKSPADGGAWAVLPQWLGRASARRPWLAATALWRAGVGVPRPIAYVRETKSRQTTVVLEFLDGYVTVEERAAELERTGASPDAIAGFLLNLAEALNALLDARAWHADCSGKNILVSSAGDVRFIDLDAVGLNTPCTARRRLKNHVQLYDSFCDLWDEATLRPLFEQLGAPAGVAFDDWMARVRAGQATRRRRQMRRWNRQGHPRAPRRGDPPSG